MSKIWKEKEKQMKLILSIIFDYFGANRMDNFLL